MKRADICASDDHDTLDRLIATIPLLGGRFGGEAFGVGLHRVCFPDGEMTVFVDAWAVDVAGPDQLVDRLLAALAGID